MITEEKIYRTTRGQAFLRKEDAELTEAFDELLKKFEEEAHFPNMSASHIVEWFFTNYTLQEKLVTTSLPSPVIL